MEPRSSQQPGLQFCSLVRAGFLALTSVLSQLLEKQRKLIAVNDRALRVWPELQARMPVPGSKALPQPRTSPQPRRGAKPCVPQSRWLVLFKKIKTPKFNQAQRCSVLHGSFLWALLQHVLLTAAFVLLKRLSVNTEGIGGEARVALVSFGEKLDLKCSRSCPDWFLSNPCDHWPWGKARGRPKGDISQLRTPENLALPWTCPPAPLHCRVVGGEWLLCGVFERGQPSGTAAGQSSSWWTCPERGTKPPGSLHFQRLGVGLGCPLP